MTRTELLAVLKALVPVSKHDPEQAHVEADRALLSYLNDPEVKQAYVDIDKWYA